MSAWFVSKSLKIIW